MQGKQNLTLHDAEIVAVAVDRLNGVACLSLRQEDSVACSLGLYGLKAFRCEDMTLQNVISRVLRSSAGEISGKALEYWLKWITSLSDADSWLSDERLLDWRSACEAGNLELVVLEPSAGAEVAALCERLVLS